MKLTPTNFIRAMQRIKNVTPIEIDVQNIQHPNAKQGNCLDNVLAFINDNPDYSLCEIVVLREATPNERVYSSYSSMSHFIVQHNDTQLYYDVVNDYSNLHQEHLCFLVPGTPVFAIIDNDSYNPLFDRLLDDNCEPFAPIPTYSVNERTAIADVALQLKKHYTKKYSCNPKLAKPYGFWFAADFINFAYAEYHDVQASNTYDFTKFLHIK